MSDERGAESRLGMMDQIRHYIRIILDWKWIGMSVFVLAVAAATLYSFLVTPVYTAVSRVWIEDDLNILPFDAIQTLGGNTSMQGHIELLLSRTLAAETIEKLALYKNPDFIGKTGKGKKAADPADPVFRERLIEGFTRSLSITPVPQTRLVNVRFNHRNPALAAEILNAQIDGYVDMIARKKSSMSEQVRESLNAPIAALRAEIDEGEKKLNEYASANKESLPLTVAETPTVNKLAEFNKALTDATIDRINKLNRFNQMKSAPLGEVPDAPPGSTIGALKAQYETLGREYSKRLLTLRSEYPEMQRLKSELDAARDALQKETKNLVAAAYADYEAALLKEQSFQKLLNDQRGEALKTNSTAVLYNALRIELESKKTILENLNKRQSETNVSSGLKGLDAINVWVVDKAHPPLKPTFPQKRKNVLYGILIGLAVAIGLALGLEYLNQTVKTSKDVSAATGLPTLGVLPSFAAETTLKGPRAEFNRLSTIIRGGEREKRNRSETRRRDPKPGSLSLSSAPQTVPEDGRASFKVELVAIRKPRSIQAESYRSIRTMLMVSSPQGKSNSVLFTSPLAGEGKSTTVANLGVTLASASLRVVIVDSDLRKPKQASIFGLDGRLGLTRFLSAQCDLTGLSRPTQVPNLHLIPSGPLPANPLELLTSKKMDQLVIHLRANFDYILFDAPPILAVSDAITLGPLADGIILISRGGITPKKALKQAKMKLDAHNLKCLGVILNGVDLVEQDGYYSKQYYHYYKTD